MRKDGERDKLLKLAPERNDWPALKDLVILAIHVFSSEV